MFCHKQCGIRPMVLLLHVLVLATLGTTLCMKDTRAGKRVLKKMKNAGEKIEEKAEDLFGN